MHTPTRRPTLPSLAPLLVTTLLALLPAPAQALTRESWTMEILVDGVPLAEHAARGTTYVEALQGREYAVRLRNNTAGRVAIALSLDGLNSIDARSTAAREARKWILAPWQTVTIEGWQTGQETARRFYFTSENESYGAWLGNTRNLGVVTAAVFREKVRRPAPIQYRLDGEGKRQAPAQPAPQSAPPAGAPEPSLGADSSRAEAAPGESDELAATGIGQQVHHPVVQVAFEAEAAPAAVMSVRYEYRDALIRLGVLPRPVPDCDGPLARRERARGFTDLGFAPDPYRPR